ncbi:hypothetical protein [Dolichospermum compactum]|uniref:Plastid lipid-associated protein/fibrillin conserved domain-containing protein n=1 Tax=Dolichospermum compactum NIES-806 TaxID=1973481 RepID=A0A1Z4V2H5_9CYAN|nr:hypothetical protein [Dolichospermum compactum]BAZ85688.1 hypothetical protein NIES806_18920 [Dolichospermum compactum NIES-806]
MTANLISNSTSDFINSLSSAATAYRAGNQLPSAEIIVNALLEAEKAAKLQKLNYPFASLNGKWRLCFATGTKKVRNRGGIILGKGWYVPRFMRIHICLNPLETQALGTGEIANQVQLGGILLKLTGPIKYLGKKNLLAFDFIKMQISLFNWMVVNKNISTSKGENKDFDRQPIAKQAFFAFFLVTEDMIAARGRGGGLALWIREN